jgi:uncharacterized cupredoxin-like copper-binding protein
MRVPSRAAPSYTPRVSTSADIRVKEGDMSRRVLRLLIGLLVPIALALPACSDDGGDASTVDVTLQEFAVVPGSSSAPAGSVTFNVTNDGPEDEHEFVVIRTDLSPVDLPTVEDGSVDEEGEGLEPVNEIEGIPVGETQTLTVDLDAGSYVLICNIYDEDEQESHYQEGMRVAFTVE